jgi:hypothetical protein
MRTLVLLLLVANLVYLGWELDRESRAAVRNGAAALPVPPGTRRLVLIRELDEPPPPREPAPQTYADPDPVLRELVAQLPDISLRPLPAAEGLSRSCFTFGPLPDERQALWLGDWFRSRQVEVRHRTTEEAPRPLFWIYLAPEGTRADAEALMQDLERQGVRDYRLITRGGLGNAVSLGLFSSQAAVNARLAELAEKGYRPVVVPYQDVTRFYWLDVAVADDPVLLKELFEGYPARYPSVPVQCSQIAMAKSEP